MAEEVFGSHVPPKLEPPQDDSSLEIPQDEGGPGVGASGLKVSSSTGLNNGDSCLHSRLWVDYVAGTQTAENKYLERSAYYYYAWDAAVNWSNGCDKCPGKYSYDQTVAPYSPGVNFWYKCAYF